MIGLLISMAALLTNCAPKSGCFFSMTETQSTMPNICTQNLAECNVLVVEVTADSR